MSSYEDLKNDFINEDVSTPVSTMPPLEEETKV